jgi:hypothetical protein
MEYKTFSNLGKRPLRELIEKLAAERGFAISEVSLPAGKSRYSAGRKVLMFDELYGCPVRRFRSSGVLGFGVEVEIGQNLCGLVIAFSEYVSAVPGEGRKKRLGVRFLPVAVNKATYFADAAVAA